MNSIPLPGCSAEPLAAYLSALGLLAVTERLIPEATLSWAGDTAVLGTGNDRFDDVVHYLLTEYAPTPVVSPWNAGAGFRRNGKSRTAEEAIAAVENSTGQRLAAYRRAVTAARSIADRYLDEDIFKRSKEAIVLESRNSLPDDALAWVDASVVFTPSGLRFPDVLGTGGNLGRVDLSANYLLRVLDILDPDTDEPTKASAGWLADALEGHSDTPRIRSTVGQYEPGTAGGINTSTLDSGEALVNPWRFVLAIEGLMFFASAVSRRLDARGRVAAPFAVHGSALGATHLTDAEGAKDHIYVPLWDRPTAASEVRMLFSEGRLSWGTGQASTTLEASRAVGSLGVERGLTGFVRYALVERLGQNMLAVPAGRLHVTNRRHVQLTQRLDGWLGRLRRLGRLPTTAREALHSCDQALLRLSEDDHPRASATEFLQRLARLEHVVGRSQTLRDEISPLPALPGRGWLPLLDDGTAEFELAAGWASLNDLGQSPDRDRLRDVDTWEEQSSWRASLAAYLRPVSTHPGANRWTSRRDPLHDVLRDGHLALSAIHVGHATQAERFESKRMRRAEEERGWGSLATSGIHPRFRFGLPVHAANVEAFIAGKLDDGRIGRLLKALSLLRFDLTDEDIRRWVQLDRVTPTCADPLYRTLQPLVAGADISGGQGASLRLTADPTWVRRLAVGHDLPRIGREAVIRYRASGLAPAVADPGLHPVGGPSPQERGSRLAAALMLHLSHTDAARLLRENIENTDSANGHPA